jgi:hypothetical protein
MEKRVSIVAEKADRHEQFIVLTNALMREGVKMIEGAIFRNWLAVLGFIGYAENLLRLLKKLAEEEYANGK